MTTNRPSFFEPHENGTFDAWAIHPTGNYAADCETGNACFDEIQRHAETTDSPTMIAHVVQAMINKGRVSGVEIGFLNSMAMQVTK